jgi:hypothetical protein
MRMLAGFAAPLVIGVLAASAHAQLPTRENYLHFIPHAPRIMGQAAASERLQLFGDVGDPVYDDTDPRDGIDDRRGRRLLALGERFSPILRRNTYHVPRSFEDVLGERVNLYADTWREGELVASAALDLGPPLDEATLVLEPALGDDGGPDRTRVAPDDAELATLLRSFHPRRTVSNVVPPEGTLETVLYFDVPGENETTWRRLHGRRLPERTRIYLHPFIHDAQEPAGDAAYELVLQFWFYYPYNDGGNNHEGDWEHVNVVVTTEARAAGGEDDPAKRGLLTDYDIGRILGSDDPLPLDSLRIWYVSYYFHNLVMRVDYLDIAAGGTLWSRRESGDGAIHVWEDTAAGSSWLAGGWLLTRSATSRGTTRARTSSSISGRASRVPTTATPTGPIPSRASGGRSVRSTPRRRYPATSCRGCERTRLCHGTS